MNIQYLIYDNELYVIEVNPRASRTVPYISKVTGVPMVDLAVRCCLGEKLKDMGLWIVGTALEGSVPIYECDMKGATGIVIGSEGEGLSRLVREKCDL